MKSSAVAASSLLIVPNTVLGKSHGHTAPTDKLNIAAVGIGGKGKADLRGCETENIVALCDVDWKYAKGTFEKYPNAKRYWDYRKMYDELGKSIDAVTIATADHTHALITADAITMGKHVYTQKPLTHTVYESRLLTRLAAKYQVATQMGNQGASGEGVNLICEWIQNGEIGEVRKVECATNRPIWPQGLMTPEKADRIPSTLNWDLFTGPAKERPFNAIYHPWNWRGWWDYGTGALGDMACHIMHPVFKDITINEELLGAYTVRMLTLNVGHEKIDFKPIGTMLIGSPGRIDVTCGVRRARIVLTGEKARSPQDHIIVTMKGDKPVRRDYGKLVWKLVDMNGLMSFVDLTPQSVQDFIMDIAQ